MTKIKKQFRVSFFTDLVIKYLSDEIQTTQTDIVEKAVYNFASQLIDEDTFNEMLRLDKESEF